MAGAVTEAEAKVRVFVVDDSPLMCRALGQILAQDPQFEVTGLALRGEEAVRLLPTTPCDVCTLDVEMPGMSGLTVLKHIMIRHPKPTLMLSALTAEGANVTFDALRYGAVDFFQKPSQNGGRDLVPQGALLRARIKRAARVQVSAARYLRLQPVTGAAPGESRAVRQSEGTTSAAEGLVVVAASTGGYAALLTLLPQMLVRPEVPMIVSLEAPWDFLQAFVDYVQLYVPFPVKRAENHEVLSAGMAYCISNEESASLERQRDTVQLLLGHRSEESERRGGLDLLLTSASEHFGPGVLAAVLSGDGVQGRAGAGEVQRSGGIVVVQRPETCLAPRLPKRIHEDLGAKAYALSDLAERLTVWRARGEARY